ncbi:MAG: hypothetical protein U0Q16_17335, partial [Bryobacteraceae bacterium]
MTPNASYRLLPLLLAPCLLCAQSLDQVVERLDRLEKENRSLRDEVSQLRRELDSIRGAPAPPASPPAEAAEQAPSVQTLDERLTVQERRTDEQAQSKVEAAQKFPVKLTGMLLANMFHNGPSAAGVDTPTTSARANGRQTGGITLRQSILGMQYTGGKTLLGGQVKGSLFMDFFEGTSETTVFYPVRVRTGSVELDWSSRSLSLVLDKPLFSQRDPNTFSYSGVSPLTAAGNLWRWQPQVRFEQRLGNETTSGRAQLALVQTSEEVNFPAAVTNFERRRPGLQGRFELAHRFGEGRRIEVAPGFHVSQSHALGQDYGSHLASVDWLFAPMSKIEFSGLFWTGENIHHFGALRQSFRLDGTRLVPVQSKGGWSQVSFPFTSRISLNLFGGIHDDRNRDLARNAIGANRAGAANIMFRIAPNLIMSIEAMQIR